MNAFFDNASTTPMLPEVLEAMQPYWFTSFGNPSSLHKQGREAKAAIENSRKKIAQILNTSSSEIYFTSGGTEADNSAISNACQTFRHCISSKLEHHAVLHFLEYYERKGWLKTHFVQHNEKGILDYASLEILLKSFPNAFVSLMHANNEIGNYNDIDLISNLCSQFEAHFHTDAVQTMGYLQYDLEKTKIHYLAASSHKFHGPKGVGFLYRNAEIDAIPLIIGGAQERNLRGGTENVAGIVGMAKALELADKHRLMNVIHLKTLKSYFINRLKEKFPLVLFNGNCLDMEYALPTVINLSLPAHPINEMLLFSLDIHNISASAGSACNSGASVSSHVLEALTFDAERAHIRFSFSKFNTIQEIDYTIETLGKILKK